MQAVSIWKQGFYLHERGHLADHVDEASQRLMKSAMNRFGLSARAYNRIFKVARTIADIEGSDKIASEHISEAILYRSLDRRVS